MGWKPPYFVAYLVAIFLCFALAEASSADDLELPLKEFPDRFVESFQKAKDNTQIVLSSCLDGTDTKRAVCSYKLDDYMVAIAAAEVGSDQLSEVTLICTAKQDLGAASCILAYAVAFDAFLPEVSVDDRGRIIHFLLNGIKFGESASLSLKSGRKVVLQKVAGSAWFHIESNDGR